MFASRSLGLAALLLTLVGCGPAEESSKQSPVPIQMDASLVGVSCDGFGQCPLGHQCANFLFADGTETGLRCLDTRRLCAEQGCPDTCLADRSTTPDVWCPR